MAERSGNACRVDGGVKECLGPADSRCGGASGARRSLQLLARETRWAREAGSAGGGAELGHEPRGAPP